MGKLHRFWLTTNWFVNHPGHINRIYHTPTQHRPETPHCRLSQTTSIHITRTLWHMAGRLGNGDPFDCGWQADNDLQHAGSCPYNWIMWVALAAVALTPPANTGPMGITITAPIHGPDESRRRGRRGSAAFHLHRHIRRQSLDEIDIEIIGKDTPNCKTNYYTNGVGRHEDYIDPALMPQPIFIPTASNGAGHHQVVC